MPTLTRYLLILLVLGAAGYGLVWSLANFIEPRPREITIRLPPDRLDRLGQ